jgi:hypothetical protein
MALFVKKSSKVAFAIVEIIAVFGIAFAIARGVGTLPSVENALSPLGEATALLLLGWIPLVVIALLADRLLRRRGPTGWGFRLVDGSVRETFRIAIYLLVLGGFLPLLLIALDGAGEQLRPTLLDQSAAILGPILAQEVFLLGYAQGRLRDEMPGPVTIFPITIAFVLAHIAHLDGTESGVLFLLAMAWQGLVWTAARAALGSIIPQIIAHAALLLLFVYPLPAAIAVGVAGLIVMTSMAHWARRKLKELRRTLRRAGTEPAKS